MSAVESVTRGTVTSAVTVAGSSERTSVELIQTLTDKGGLPDEACSAVLKDKGGLTREVAVPPCEIQVDDMNFPIIDDKASSLHMAKFIIQPCKASDTKHVR